MNPDSPARDSTSETTAARQHTDSPGQAGKTPNPDMQPEDAGSTDSGTAATRAMKQTSKTDADSGGKR